MNTPESTKTPAAVKHVTLDGNEAAARIAY